MAEIRLRPSQESILSYRSGKMGIAAVPGAGKTFTLSLLAADILLRGGLKPGQEILIVTLVNSAVDNFSARVGSLLRTANLLPGMGYRVRTLHGLSHDIVRERPEAVGLANDFQILDDNDTSEILRQISTAWLRANPLLIESYLKEDLDEQKVAHLRREDLPRMVETIARETIAWSKDKELTPDRLRARLDELPMPLPLADMGWSLYHDYQRAVSYRGGVDFDDLIRLALLALRSDAKLVERLRNLWPYILEDEAQDSSRLQELILEALSGPRGNWVRVGDPNQAIYETFTTANPRYLQEFRDRKDVRSEDLPESGRSMQSVLDLANHLIEWAQTKSPEALHEGLNPPYVLPTQPDDPQPNPPDVPEAIALYRPNLEAARELEVVAGSIAKYLSNPDNQNKTVAVLVPRNKRGDEMVDELRKRKVDVVDSLLRSTAATRASAGALTDILNWLSDPKSSSKLSKSYRVWRRSGKAPAEEKPLIERCVGLLHSIRNVEDYLAPLPDRDWLERDGLDQTDPSAYEQLGYFREAARRWQSAVLLPVDQLVLTLAQDIFSEPPDLAIAHKMAGVLRQRANAHPAWQLPELTEEVAAVARNERKFLGFSQEDTNFNPDDYKGKVVVATIHKAKGLEWDRVYLLSVNNYDFPSGAPFDTYISEKWFIRANLNLEAESLAQLETAHSSGEYDWYEEGKATQQARVDYARERLRLFYVGITRARSELVITWNTGRDGKLVPSRPFQELMDFWEMTHGPR
jgi:DNA helicase II / ATP-dependent DNA helicase PcrA